MNKQSLSVRDIIISRRSIKLFNGQPVDQEELFEIINDAVWAPNHGNREPWRCIVGVGNNLPKIHEVLRNIAIPKWQDLTSDELDKQMKKFTLPGAVVFVVVKEDVRQKERLEDFAAASCFIQNMQLLAWEREIGTCWKTPPFIENPALYKSLDVNPGERIIGMLQFGYFDEIPKGKERKTVDQIVTLFGE